jgi:serine/threonine-protein kinase
MNAEDSNAQRFHVGSTIAGRYRVERPIGEGAMGAVALARHVSLDEAVAIKFLPPELRRDPVANARLAREAKALARIKSDHVARVLDVGTTLSVGPYMVMEYLEGVDLGEVLETEGPLPVPRAVECVLQVCEALTVAHTAGITHRDIKPQNLFLARHGQFETLKILDFGIAEDAGPPSSTRLGAVTDGACEGPAREVAAVYGTPSYMAPERIRNDPDADHRSDIWSVGVVLHELVTGRAVFDAETITDTCARILSDEPIPLEPSNAMLPPSLRGIICRCLERDPARRYQSIEELAAALAPLGTMHERFRGRSTGAFSRRLVEEELARMKAAPSPLALPAPPWQAAAAAVKSSLAWFRQRLGATYVALAAASAGLVTLGAWQLGDLHWMAPPPTAVPIRAESSSAAGRASRAEGSGERGTPRLDTLRPDTLRSGDPRLAGAPAEGAALVGAPVIGASATGAALELESALPLPAASESEVSTTAFAEPISLASSAPPPAEASAIRGSAHAGSRRSGEAGGPSSSTSSHPTVTEAPDRGNLDRLERAGRSRVRLVQERGSLEPRESRETTASSDARTGAKATTKAQRDSAPAASEKKQRSKKVRPRPAWLEAYQTKSP